MVKHTSKEEILRLLDQVFDPEIPTLTIREMGMLRGVEISKEGKVTIRFTPTYSGCPATDLIKVDIKAVLQENGIEAFEIIDVLSPPWTTDDFTEEARKKLRDNGIAPPVQATSDKSFVLDSPKIVPCPYCQSENTELLSNFGTTACKALYRCKSCLQPFDYFKCH